MKKVSARKEAQFIEYLENLYIFGHWYETHNFTSNGGHWYFPAKAAIVIMHNRYQDFCVSKNLQGLQPVTQDTAIIDLMGADQFPEQLYYNKEIYKNKIEFKLFNN